jgi:hypothetical protein
MQDTANRLSGGMDADLVGDPVAGHTHKMDALLICTHEAAQMETMRKAEQRGTDVLVRQRAAIQANSSQSSVDDTMLALGKKEANANKFFQIGGSGTHQPTGFPIPGHPSTATPSFPTSSPIPSLNPFQPVVNAGPSGPEREQEGSDSKEQPRSWRQIKKGMKRKGE